MFRHADAKLMQESRKPGFKDSKQLSVTASPKSSHDRAWMRAGEESQFLLSGIGRSLLPSKEDLSICFFYQTTLESLIDVHHSLYLHLQLPILFSHSQAGSALHLATQAISLANWARSRPNDINASRLSRMRYSQSLLAMKSAIRDPAEAKSDETLYTVLLLSGYEVRLLQLEFWFMFPLIHPDEFSYNATCRQSCSIQKHYLHGVHTLTAPWRWSETVARRTFARRSHATCFFLFDETR